MESRFLDKRVSLPFQILVWALSFYVAWYVVPKGYEKLMDIPGTIEFFAKLGFPAFMAYVVGILEIAAPIAMLIPRLSFYGAVPTTVIMLVASYSMSWNTWPMALGVLSLVVAIIARPGYLRKKQVITKISA